MCISNDTLITAEYPPPPTKKTKIDIGRAVMSTKCITWLINHLENIVSYPLSNSYINSTSGQYGGMLSTNKVRSRGLRELFSARTLCSFTYSWCGATLSEPNCRDSTEKRKRTKQTHLKPTHQLVCLLAQGDTCSTRKTAPPEPCFKMIRKKLRPKIKRHASERLEYVSLILSSNTCKSARNNTRLATGMFLLGRRHLVVTSHTGSTTKTKYRVKKSFI